MAGLYLHIPFCKQACHYCDFHFSTNRDRMDELVLAMVREMELQRNYLGSEPLETIYFGGGTPSLLPLAQLSALIKAANDLFPVTASPEVTLEANPDDLTREKIQGLVAAGINRLSIGIQSFNDTVLQLFNRAHNADQAEACVAEARALGFGNISVDLIYGVPNQSLDALRQDLDRFIKLAPQHISAYALTIEEKTVFGHQQKKGIFSALPENETAEHFELVMAHLASAGYEQYEISNFCTPGNYSKHNASYWQQKKYLGIGPSAHSYNGQSRQWNVANNHLYLRALSEGTVPFEREVLTPANQINEYFFTTLRTRWGTDLHYLKEVFDFSPDRQKIETLQQQSLIQVDNERLTLTPKGKLLADKIALEFFIDEG
ncbi:MAG: radical SAM family heme chaperone HemW [Flammeovirgaceae bacterium]